MSKLPGDSWSLERTSAPAIFVAASSFGGVSDVVYVRLLGGAAGWYQPGVTVDRLSAGEPDEQPGVVKISAGAR